MAQTYNHDDNSNKKLDINTLYRKVIVLYSYMFPNTATLCNLHFAFVLQA